MDWADIIKTVLTNAVFLSVLGFVAKSIFQQVLSENAERFKTELQAAHGRELAKFRADLEMAAFERQTRFARFHEERAQVIAKLYGLLVKTQRVFVNNITFPIEIRSEDKSMLAASANFFDYLDEHQIYLDECLCAKLHSFHQTLLEIVGEYKVALAYDPTQDAEAFMRFKRSYDKVLKKIPELRQEIEQAFRETLV